MAQTPSEIRYLTPPSVDIKKKLYCRDILRTVFEFAVPSLLILIGFMFLFHQGKAVNFIFVISGILTIMEGGLLLANAILEEK